MGILDAPAIDPVTRKPSGILLPRRDLPLVVFDFDASKLTGNNGDSIKAATDSGPLAADVYGVSGAYPTLAKDALGTGLHALSCAAGQYLTRSSTFFGSGRSSTLSGFAQPVSGALVAKFNTGSLAAARVAMAATGFTVNLNTSGQLQIVNGATTLAYGGGAINDDSWHILCWTAATSWASSWVDGYLVGTTNSNAGTNKWAGITIGAAPGGTTPMNGHIAEAILFNAELQNNDVADITATLAQKWGLA